MVEYIGVGGNGNQEDLEQLIYWWGTSVVDETLEKIAPDDPDDDFEVELKDYKPGLTEDLKKGLTKFLDHMSDDVDALNAFKTILKNPASYVHQSLQRRIDLQTNPESIDSEPRGSKRTESRLSTS